MENKKINLVALTSIVIVAVVVALVFLGKDKTISLDNSTSQNTTATENRDIVVAKYSDGNTTIEVVFNNHPTDFKKSTVTFGEPTIGNVTLPTAISGSGARYANTDESIVFWEHQGKATITKDGEEVFVGKIISTNG